MDLPRAEDIQEARDDFSWTQDELEVFSYLQRTTAEWKIRGASYQVSQEHFGLNLQQQVYNVLSRTFAVFYWDRQCTWHRGYLSDVDAHHLIGQLRDRAGDLNCVFTHEVLMLIEDLQADRIRRSRLLAALCGCDRIMAELPIAFPKPCTRWLTEFCQSHNLRIRNAQTLEAARRAACTVETVNNFFRENRRFLDRDPHLLFNVDETSACFTRTFKAVVPDDFFPLTEAPHSLGNMTAVFVSMLWDTL